MRVAFVTPSVSRRLGGIFEIERRLAQTLDARPDIHVDVFGLEDADTAADLASWAPLAPRVFPVTGPAAFGYARGLGPALAASGADLAHLHALWMYPSAAVLRWALRTGRPHVVTANGMLDPWAVRNSRGKKRVAGALYEHAQLRRAACIQVNTEQELASVRAFGLANPVCVIPNGVDLPQDGRPTPPPWAGRIPEGARVLLYLGRIHPKKGLAELVEAWGRVRREARSAAEPWALAVAGWDDGGHVAGLRAQADALGEGAGVHFLGPLFGEAKAAAYAHAAAFALPSKSEGQPMTVLEAWAQRLPVLLTPACNLDDGVRAGAALSSAPEPAALTRGLMALFGMSDGERGEMGTRGRALVEGRYTWPRVAEELHAVYAWVLGGGTPPASVRRS